MSSPRIGDSRCRNPYLETDVLEELIKALNAHTAALVAHTAALGGSTPAATATTGKTDKPAGTKPAGTKKDTKPKGPTLDDVKEKFGGYLANQKGEEKARRMKQVQTINEHFGVERATLLDPSKFEEALGYLQAYIDGEEPEFPETENEDEDEGVV